MVYSRGNPRDYDDWEAAGAAGWGYTSVLPYFLRSENNQDLPASLYHGRGGPMNVRWPARPNRLNNDFIAATESLGLQANIGLHRCRFRGSGLSPRNDSGRQA